MKTAVINIKIEQKIKQDAQKIAGELGFSLSSLITAQLKQLVRTRTFTIVAPPLKLTPYAKKMIKEVREARKKGDTSPVFTKMEDAIKWLDSDK